MMDTTLESYWQGIHADLRETFGPPGEDVTVTSDEAAARYISGVTTARAALEIGVGNGLEPVNDTTINAGSD